MSEHYRRGDPETGCALMLLTAIVVMVIAVIVLAIVS